MLDNSTNKGRMAWQIINKITNCHYVQENVALKVDESISDDPALLVDKFNTFFRDAPINLVENLKQTDYICNLDKIKCMEKSMYLSEFSESEVLKILKIKLKRKLSCGPDEIPTMLLIKSSDFIIKPLTYLINLSFSAGIFPLN